MTFKEFCKGFNRMFDECPNADNPFVDAANSDYAEDWLAWAIMQHPDEAEDYVATWVKNNPEPIYPTFGEYLRDMANHDVGMSKVPLKELLDMPIPDAVAEKYKVAPLNPCGVSKYASEWR